MMIKNLSETILGQEIRKGGQGLDESPEMGGVNSQKEVMKINLVSAIL